MTLSSYDRIYFLGIGGIGMSALARWFVRKGMMVSGYDKTATTLTRSLEAEGIAIHYDDARENIPHPILDDASKTLIVFTPAVPKDSIELNYFLQSGYTVMKRSEVLGLITKDYRTIAIAGTHGKTTTSSMVAHILHEAGFNMVGFLGGITANYNSNLVMQGEVNADTVVVVEADEYDRSFHRLFPHVAIVTSADADHLDIYGDHQAVIDSFKQFIRQIDSGGTLVVHESIDAVVASEIHDINKSIYGMSRGQFFAGNITPGGGFFEFDLHGFVKDEHVRLGVPGFHNVENSIAAAIAAHACGVDMESIIRALQSFRGVKRRFEFIVRSKRVTYIDDYAHHPAEIAAFLTSLKALFVHRKITVIFQPHLYSRTQDFASEFAKSLSLADELILLDIYPARELPIPGVTSDLIYDLVTSPVKSKCSKENLMKLLKNQDLDVLATMGAGDIDTFVEPIKNQLLERYAETEI